jgi:putative oxygen-independent coproporphyrinogen III oxidase
VSGASPAPAFGVYLHVPFCVHRCDYCAFAAWDDRDDLIGDYLAALRAEVGAAVADGLPPATSVFVGGGTPSLVPAAGLVAVLRDVPLAPGAEVTVECNPETVDDALVAAYREGGVNRLSFGVQSFVPHVLASLGRGHDPAQARRAVAAARRQGIEDLNLDLIYGAAGETLDDWRVTLDAALALEPTHVSAYALTVEPGTPLAVDAARHPDDDDQAAKYQLASARLEAAGLAWYEISNWARSGHECRHNRLYWAQGDYRGFGCAAHSHRAGRRWWNVRTPERYVEAVRAGRPPIAGEEELDDETRHLEALQLAVRTVAGVPTGSLADDDRRAVDGLVAERDGRLVLTRTGRLLANEVAVRLR